MILASIRNGWWRCVFVCNKRMVYRNVDQLELHLAALENGVGKDSGCKSVDIAVRDLMRIGISAREAKQDRARQQSEHRKAVEKA